MLCRICDDPPAGLGPFSSQPLCQEHLAVDLADARRHLDDVAGQLDPYRGGGVNSALAAIAEEQRALERQQLAMQRAFDAARHSLELWQASVMKQLEDRLDSLRTCQLDCEDVHNYDGEVAAAEMAGDMAEACRLALAMQLSVGDLQADFAKAHALREVARDAAADLRDVERLQRTIDNLACGGANATDAAIAAHPETRPIGTSVRDIHAPMVKSLSVELDDWITWVTACCDTGGFAGDATGRVVPANESAGDDNVTLVPQPCLILAFNTCDKKDHLVVASIDGTVKLRCHCPAVNWQESICGIICDSRQLFVAQDDAVTEMDLSGRLVRKIGCPNDFGGIWGIGSCAYALFVSGGNKIAEIDKATGQLKKVITLVQIPDAMLSSLAVWEDFILVRDRRHGKVHKVSISAQQLVATHPTQLAGIAKFETPRDVVVDSKGRMFVSEFTANSVRVVASDDGSLLRTLGTPAGTGGDGADGDKLDAPCGLTVLTGGRCEQLVVACSPPTMFRSRRLVVFDLH